MDFDRQVVALVERAMDDSPLCSRCGQPMTVNDDAGRLWLTCTALDRPRSRFGRVVDVLVGHDRELIADLAELAA